MKQVIYLRSLYAGFAFTNVLVSLASAQFLHGKWNLKENPRYDS